MKKYIFLLFTLVIVIQVGIVAAKDEKKGSNDTNEIRTKEVVITATKYKESVIEVPMAVSVIPEAQIINKRGYGLNEVLSLTPGVLAQSRFGNQDIRITIRGFGARGAGDRSNAGTSRGIKVYLDGIPETEPDGRTSFDNIDISLARNIEVIRSNSSALWGNAAGGVISISTVPAFSKSFADLSFQAGSYGFTKYVLDAGAALGSGRITGAVSATKFNGYRQNSESERYVINLGVVSPMSESTLLGVFLLGSDNRFNIPGPLTQIQYDTMPTMANLTYLTRKERRFNRQGRIGMTLEHNFNDMNNLSFMTYLNPKYLQRSERGTFRDFTRYHTGGSMNYRNTLKFNENTINTAMIGFDEAYQDGAILFYLLTPEAGRSDTLQQDKAEGANSFGTYFQDEIRFGESLSLILGGRYDNVTYYSQNYLASDKYEKKSFEHFTPKGGISYRLSTTNSLYFNIGGGVEVPAGNETDPAPGADTVYLINPLLEPIISTTYELGSKNIFEFGNGFLKNIIFDAALYYIDVKNDIIPYNGGRFYFTAGKSGRTGAEIGLDLDFDYGLSLMTALTYSNNKYVDYKIDSVHFKKPGAFADYSDNKIAGIPDMYYNVVLRFAPVSLSGLYAEASVLGVGNYFADDANKYEVPSYSVINLSLGLAEPLKIIDGISIRGFAALNNVLDKQYVSSAFINPDIDKKSGLPMYLEPGLPRNFVIGLTLMWQ